MLVKARFHEQGSVLKGDAEGFCDGFEIQIYIDSDEEHSAISDLIRLARQMCFTEKALLGNTPVEVTDYINHGNERA